MPTFLILPNREEKSLRHVAIVATFLDDNKPKTSLKKWIRTASNFIYLIQFHLMRQMLAKFSWVESERTVSKFKRGKRQLLCCIHRLHKASAQRQQRNVQNSVMHVQICCFVNKNLLLFCRSSSVVVFGGFVVIQKECYHGDVTSYFSL